MGRLCLLGAIAVGFLFFAASRATMTNDQPSAKPAAGLELLRVELPDGDRWLLGERGLGRPFVARLLLTNRGETPLKIWHPDCTEGSAAAGVWLIPGDGKKLILRRKPVERAAGVATAKTIKPNEVVRIDLELLRLIDSKSPAAGTYRVVGVYENDLPRVEQITVWSGRLEKAADHAISIVRP